jgi:hypothetical protein
MEKKRAERQAKKIMKKLRGKYDEASIVHLLLSGVDTISEVQNKETGEWNLMVQNPGCAKVDLDLDKLKEIYKDQGIELNFVPKEEGDTSPPPPPTTPTQKVLPVYICKKCGLQITDNWGKTVEQEHGTFYLHRHCFEIWEVEEKMRGGELRYRDSEEDEEDPAPIQIDFSVTECGVIDGCDGLFFE